MIEDRRSTFYAKQILAEQRRSRQRAFTGLVTGYNAEAGSVIVDSQVMGLSLSTKYAANGSAAVYVTVDRRTLVKI